MTNETAGRHERKRVGETLLQSLLDDFRVRLVLFGLVAAFMLFLLVRAMAMTGDASAPVLEPETPPALPAETINPSPRPEPATTAPEEPAPTSSSALAIQAADVVRFLEASNTFSWQDTPAEFVSTVVAAGAALGTPAANPPYEGQFLTECIEQRCSTEFLRAEEVTLGREGAPITASIEVRYIRNGETFDLMLYCTVTPTAGNTEEGLFTESVCLGPEG